MSADANIRVKRNATTKVRCPSCDAAVWEFRNVPKHQALMPSPRTEQFVTLNYKNMDVISLVCPRCSARHIRNVSKFAALVREAMNEGRRTVAT